MDLNPFGIFYTVIEILRAIADTFKVSAEQANGLVNIRETKIEQ